MLKVGTLTKHVTDAVFSDIVSASKELKDMDDKVVRRRRLLEIVQKDRIRVLRLFAVIQWARSPYGSDIMQLIQRIVRAVKQQESHEYSVSVLQALRNWSDRVATPQHDIPAALRLLTRGHRAAPLPASIPRSIFPAAEFAVQEQPGLQSGLASPEVFRARMTDILRRRLPFMWWPDGWSEPSFRDGTLVTGRAGLFELCFSLESFRLRAPWLLLGMRLFPPSDQSASSDRLEGQDLARRSALTPSENQTEGLRRFLQHRLSVWPELDSADGLSAWVRLDRVLHRILSALALESLFLQASELVLTGSRRISGLHPFVRAQSDRRSNGTPSKTLASSALTSRRRASGTPDTPASSQPRGSGSSSRSRSSAAAVEARRPLETLSWIGTPLAASQSASVSPELLDSSARGLLTGSAEWGGGRLRVLYDRRRQVLLLGMWSAETRRRGWDPNTADPTIATHLLHVTGDQIPSHLRHPWLEASSNTNPSGAARQRVAMTLQQGTLGAQWLRDGCVVLCVTVGDSSGSGLQWTTVPRPAPCHAGAAPLTELSWKQSLPLTAPSGASTRTPSLVPLLWEAGRMHARRLSLALRRWVGRLGRPPLSPARTHASSGGRREVLLRMPMRVTAGRSGGRPRRWQLQVSVDPVSGQLQLHCPQAHLLEEGPAAWEERQTALEGRLLERTTNALVHSSRAANREWDQVGDDGGSIDWMQRAAICAGWIQSKDTTLGPSGKRQRVAGSERHVWIERGPSVDARFVACLPSESGSGGGGGDGGGGGLRWEWGELGGPVAQSLGLDRKVASAESAAWGVDYDVALHRLRSKGSGATGSRRLVGTRWEAAGDAEELSEVERRVVELAMWVQLPVAGDRPVQLRRTVPSETRLATQVQPLSMIPFQLERQTKLTTTSEPSRRMPLSLTEWTHRREEGVGAGESVHASLRGSDFVGGVGAAAWVRVCAEEVCRAASWLERPQGDVVKQEL